MTPMLLLAACTHGEPEEAARPSIEERVDYASPARAALLPVATLPAEVVPAPDGVQSLGTGVDARLVRWHVAPGDPIERGAPLAELKSPGLEALQAHASELAATARQRQQQLTLAEAAAARGVASASDVEAARTAFVEASAAQTSSERDLRARRDTLTPEGDHWIWRAPTAGTVGALRCTLGSIGASESCLTLVQPEGVVLEVQVPERLLGLLDERSHAELIAADGRKWPFAELGRAPTIDPHVRSRTFRYTSEGTETPLQGTSGRARITVVPNEPVYTVPIEALTHFEGEPTVFVAHQDGPIPKRIEVLAKDREQAWIRGVQDGQQVAVRGVFLLKSLALLEQG